MSITPNRWQRRTNNSGRWVSAAPTSRPPFEPPPIASLGVWYSPGRSVFRGGDEIVEHVLLFLSCMPASCTLRRTRRPAQVRDRVHPAHLEPHQHAGADAGVKLMSNPPYPTGTSDSGHLRQVALCVTNIGMRVPSLLGRTPAPLCRQLDQRRVAVPWNTAVWRSRSRGGRWSWIEELREREEQLGVVARLGREIAHRARAAGRFRLRPAVQREQPDQGVRVDGSSVSTKVSCTSTTFSMTSAPCGITSRQRRARDCACSIARDACAAPDPRKSRPVRFKDRRSRTRQQAPTSGCGACSHRRARASRTTGTRCRAQSVSLRSTRASRARRCAKVIPQGADVIENVVLVA